MRILALMNNPSGVDYHRIIKPLTRLNIDHPETEIFKAQGIDRAGLPDLTKYDLIVFNRYLYSHHLNALRFMAEKKIPYVIDIDDYWILPQWHPNVDYYKKNGLKQAIIEAIRYANGVTCTTEVLAAEIRQINPRVCILPNTIDTTDEQWNQPKVKHESFRFGYVGGASHKMDVSMLADGIREVVARGGAFTYCGFNPQNKHSIDIINRLNGHDKEMKIDLMPGQSPEVYGKSLAHFDCMVAPLKQSKFGDCKSDIKILEAAAYGLPILCSDVAPYRTHKDNPGVTLVSDDGWKEAMINIMETKGHGIANQVYCGQMRNIEVVNEKRLEFYKTCLQSSTIPDRG